MSGGKEDEENDRKEKKTTWGDFFWNPRTQEMMGRTFKSWGLILLFYLVFYLFLAGVFVLTMWVMLLTLDEYTPTWQDRLTTPGMMIRPRGEALDKEALNIFYNIQESETWDRYVQSLDDFLKPYDNSLQVQNNDVCIPDQYFIQEDSGEVRNNPKRACQFNRTMLDFCSGTDDRYYGYQEGRPCVIIKLNRVIGMLPGKDGQSPYVSCRSKTGGTLGAVQYYPPNGTYNLMYYPYYGKRAQINYTQPLVAVKFLNLTMNTELSVECRINSNTLETGIQRDKFAGRVSFKIKISV